MMGHNTFRLHTSHDALTFKTFNKAQDDALVRAIEAGRSSDVASMMPRLSATTPAPEAGTL